VITASSSIPLRVTYEAKFQDARLEYTVRDLGSKLRFLTVPTEIRRLIYREVLGPAENLFVLKRPAGGYDLVRQEPGQDPFPTRAYGIPRSPEHVEHSKLLCLCRLVKSEVTEMIWERAELVIYERHLDALDCGIGPGVAKVSRLTIETTAKTKYHFLRQLVHCPQLHHLTLVTMDFYHDPRGLAKALVNLTKRLEACNNKDTPRRLLHIYPNKVGPWPNSEIPAKHNRFVDELAEHLKAFKMDELREKFLFTPEHMKIPIA